MQEMWSVTFISIKLMAKSLHSMFSVAPILKHRGGEIMVWVCMMTKRVGHIFKVTEMLVTTMSGKCYESKYTQPRSW